MIHIFLDDYRNPVDVTWVALPELPWLIVRTPEEFKHILSVHSADIQTISFDYHLDDPVITGADCVTFMLEVCHPRIPVCYFHSRTPAMCDLMQALMPKARSSDAYFS